MLLACQSAAGSPEWCPRSRPCRSCPGHDPPAVPAEKEWRSGHVKVILIKAAEVTEVALILHGRRLGGPWYASRHACVVKSKEL